VKLVVFASAWTFGSLDACITRAREDGPFEGVEGPVPRERARALRGELDGIPLLAELCTGGDYAPPSAVAESVHFEHFRMQLDSAAEAGAFLVNCLTGSDAWPLGQSIDYLGRALEHAQTVGVEVSFETHRGRPTFHPTATLAILRALPALQLTCDFSHWCVVCERLVDHEPALALAIERARHVHARVGYAQGPQVPDPRAPEFALELARHEAWWSAIWDSASRRSITLMPLTPEFGPDGYLHQLPYTRAPVADLTELNTWMAARQRARFSLRR
jgi:hypothetical protein